MSKKGWSLILKAPALILLIIIFLTGIYAAIYDIQEMSWEVPIILGVVIFLYFLGSQIERSDYNKLKNELKKTVKKKEKEEIEDIEEI